MSEGRGTKRLPASSAVSLEQDLPDHRAPGERASTAVAHGGGDDRSGQANPWLSLAKLLFVAAAGRLGRRA